MAIDNNKNEIAEKLKAKIRQRFWFAGALLFLYGFFLLSYLEFGKSLGKLIGNSQVSFSLLIFIVLILAFLLLEAIFLRINNKD